MFVTQTAHHLLCICFATDRYLPCYLTVLGSTPGRAAVLSSIGLAATLRLAALTGHGDFAWHHDKFQYNDDRVRRMYMCGKRTNPEHLAHCTKARKFQHMWPSRPGVLDTTQHRRSYLWQLMANPESFRKFLGECNGLQSRQIQRDSLHVAGMFQAMQAWGHYGEGFHENV